MDLDSITQMVQTVCILQNKCCEFNVMDYFVHSYARQDTLSRKNREKKVLKFYTKQILAK